MTSWSYSQYSAAVKCLRYYKLVYIDRIVPDVPYSGDLAFGSALHSAINSILTGDSGSDIFNIYWDTYKEKEMEWGRFKWAELRELGLNFLSKFGRLHAKKYEIKSAEVRMYGEYKGIQLEGTADFIGTYDGKLSLRDFKTSGYQYPKDKQYTALQLNLYAHLSEANGFGYPESLGYTVFNKGTGSIQDLTWAFNKAVMFEHLDNMVTYIETMERDDSPAGIVSWPKNPNACQLGSIKCNMFDICWSKK